MQFKTNVGQLLDLQKPPVGTEGCMVQTTDEVLLQDNINKHEQTTDAIDPPQIMSLCDHMNTESM